MGRRTSFIFWLNLFKANVNKHKFTRKTVEVETLEYIEAVNGTINEDLKLNVKRPLSNKEEGGETTEIRKNIPPKPFFRYVL